MLRHTVDASTCNVLWPTFSSGTCLRVCHRWGVMRGRGCNLHRLWLQQQPQGKKVDLVIKVKPSVEDLSVFVEPQSTCRAVVAIVGCCYGNRWCTYRILCPSCRVNLNQIREVLKISECVGALHNVWRGIRLFYGVLLMELHLHSISCSSYTFMHCCLYEWASPPPLTVQQYGVISHAYRALDWFGMSSSFVSFGSAISAAWRISPSPVRVLTGLLWAVWHSLRCFLLFILPVDLLSHFDLPHCSISESWNQWWEGENFGVVVQKWV